MMALASLLTVLAAGLLLLKERGRRWPSPAIFLLAAPLGLLTCAAVVTVAWYFRITPYMSES